MKGIRSFFPAAAGIVISFAVIAGCSAKPVMTEEAAAAEEPVRKTVKTVKVGQVKIAEPLEQVADVLPSVQIDVFAETSAEVVEILKQRGDWVEAGETVVRLKQDDARLALEAAELALRSAQLSYSTGDETIANQKKELANQVAKLEQQVKETQENFNFMRHEYDLGNVTDRELEKAETQLEMLKADLELLKDRQKAMEAQLTFETYEIQLEQAQIQYEQAKRQLDRFTIKAPISGLLTELPLEMAMTAQPGMKALQVVQTDPVIIKAELTQDFYERVQGKSELSFYVPGTMELTSAKISFLSPVMNAAAKSYTLELEVPNPDQVLKPGMKAQVLLSDEEDEIVTAIPTSSIVREGSETYVFVLKGDTVERRAVTLGRLNGTMQEVLSGVEAGEDLVISGQHQLTDQEKVHAGGNEE